MNDDIVVRDFEPKDAVSLGELFKSDLERFFSYLTSDKKAVLLEVNSKDRFIELSKRPHDFIKVIEKNGKIIGYFHFGKDKEKETALKIQRIHITTPKQGIFKNYVYPMVMDYAKKNNFKEIRIYIFEHLLPYINKMFPGAKYCGPVVKHRRDVNFLFYLYSFEL